MSEIINYEELGTKLINFNHELVLLDKDVAELYDIKPSRLKEQIKRNIHKFPNAYAYQVSDDVGKYGIAKCDTL